MKEPKPAGIIEPLKNDLLKIQAFKNPSASVDQIIYPRAEILVFSDFSVLFAPEDEELEMHLDIYQFIMSRLTELQSMYFTYHRYSWEPNSVSVLSQLSKYGIDFTFDNRHIITTFTQEFKTRLFNAANVQVV